MRSTKSSSQCSRELPDSWAWYFVAVDDTHGVSIQVFETEEQAKAAAPPETGPGMGGVTLDTVQFGYVIGAA